MSEYKIPSSGCDMDPTPVLAAGLQQAQPTPAHQAGEDHCSQALVSGLTARVRSGYKIRGNRLREGSIGILIYALLRLGPVATRT